MLNYIWMGMLAAGFLLGMLNGRTEEVVQAAFDSAGYAVRLGIGLLGILCLWSGLMGIAEKSGLTNLLARMARPVLSLLFPEIAGNNAAMGAILMNLSANFLGLGNAATPLGLRAMGELQKVNRRKDTATDSMCMFLVLNASAFQLIPATVIALRTEAHSADPPEIIAAVWIASMCATAAGIAAAGFLSRTWGRKADQRRLI
jgi:spore maturation protein A